MKELEVTVRAPLVAVTVWEPAVLSVTSYEPEPLERAAGAGRTAAASLEVIVTLPVRFVVFR